MKLTKRYRVLAFVKENEYFFVLEGNYLANSAIVRINFARFPDQ